jgi:hypothetical protein
MSRFQGGCPKQYGQVVATDSTVAQSLRPVIEMFLRFFHARLWRLTSREMSGTPTWGAARAACGSPTKGRSAAESCPQGRMSAPLSCSAERDNSMGSSRPFCGAQLRRTFYSTALRRLARHCTIPLLPTSIEHTIESILYGVSP